MLSLTRAGPHLPHSEVTTFYPLSMSLPLNYLQTYDPTIEDAYRKQLVVDNRMCFVEVIDTAGQGKPTPSSDIQLVVNLS
jgi:hypothetical protein